MPEPAVALVRGRAAAAAAVVAVLLAGAAAVSKSAGLALATRSPDTALRVDPGNSIALAQAALRDVQVDQSAAARERVRGMAARAIRRDAANATALSALGLATAGRVLVSGDTTPHSKPHPAPLLEAARRMAVEPSRCWYVGDDLRDVQAGRAAGMTTVVAAWGYLGEGEPVSAWEADHVAESPTALLKLLGMA